MSEPQNSQPQIKIPATGMPLCRWQDIPVAKKQLEGTLIETAPQGRTGIPEPHGSLSRMATAVAMVKRSHPWFVYHLAPGRRFIGLIDDAPDEHTAIASARSRRPTSMHVDA